MDEGVMKLLSYRDGGVQRVGFLGDGDLIAPVAVPGGSDLSPMRRLLSGGAATIDAACAEAVQVAAMGIRFVVDMTRER